MGDGRLSHSGGSASRTPNSADTDRMPEGYDWDINLFDVNYDPAEWFGAEYRSLLDDVPRENYAGWSTYLGQPSLRYETRVEREGSDGADMPSATLVVTDYLIENPYVFIENEYSLSTNGDRQLERQFMRYQFELTHCTAGEQHDAVAVAVWQELAERGAEAYEPIRDGLREGCHLTSRMKGVHSLDYRGDPLPGGPAEAEGRYSIARGADDLWRVTGETVVRQKGDIVYGTRMTIDGIWILDIQTGEWRRESSLTNQSYEDLSRLLPDYISAIGRLVDVEGSPMSSDHGRYYDYRYAGRTEIDGRAAARYEQVSAHAQAVGVDDGLRMQVEVYEFFEDNPLESRQSIYSLLPNGELRPAGETTVDDLRLENCPG